MHKKILHLVFALVICFLEQSFTYSQQPVDQADQKDKWIRVQSNNGEFSIEIPAKYKFYYNKDGFYITENSNDYRLANMRMLNTFNAGTLLSFEVYEAKKDALDKIYSDDIYKKKDIDKSKLKRSDHTIQQIVQKTDKSYLVRQYFSSKTHIYILTAASRVNETTDMRRFLNSLVFSPNTKDGPNSKDGLLSALPTTEVGIESKPDDEPFPAQAKTKPPDKPKDENLKSFVIISKPQASYVEQARQKRVTGTVRVKATLSSEGFVPNIVVLKRSPTDYFFRLCLPQSE